MFYEDRVFNFQRKHGAKNWWVWGEDRCLNVPNGLEDRISSIRFSGAPDDWKYDTINFYSDPAFIGSELFTYGNRPTLGKMDNRARSLIGQLQCTIGDVRVKCKVGCKM